MVAVVKDACLGSNQSEYRISNLHIQDGGTLVTSSKTGSENHVTMKKTKNGFYAQIRKPEVKIID